MSACHDLTPLSKAEVGLFANGQLCRLYAELFCPHYPTGSRQVKLATLYEIHPPSMMQLLTSREFSLCPRLWVHLWGSRMKSTHGPTEVFGATLQR